MKPTRALILAVFGYGALLASTASQAREHVELSLPGVSVRLPAPPHHHLPLPHISIGRDYDDDHHRHGGYHRIAEPPRYYREDWRHERRGHGYGHRHHHHHHRHHRHHHGHRDWRD